MSKLDSIIHFLRRHWFMLICFAAILIVIVILIVLYFNTLYESIKEIFQPIDYIIGLVIVVIGLGLNIILIIRRGLAFPVGTLVNRDDYRNLTYVAMTGVFIAFLGFFILANSPQNVEGNYLIVLTILSLLSAGLIAGFFTFTYGRMSKDAPLLPHIIGGCFITLFFFLFGLISFYMGKSNSIHTAEGMSVFGPIFMLLILLALVLFDWWDYGGVLKFQKKHTIPT